MTYIIDFLICLWYVLRMKLRLIFVLLFALCLNSCEDECYSCCTYEGKSYSWRYHHPDDPCLICWSNDWVEAPGCCIDGVFYPPAAINPENQCESCLSYASKYQWALRNWGCCINGVFYSDYTINPDNDCEWCTLPDGIYGPLDYWSPRRHGALCEGGECDGAGNCN